MEVLDDNKTTNILYENQTKAVIKMMLNHAILHGGFTLVFYLGKRPTTGSPISSPPQGAQEETELPVVGKRGIIASG
jgi:hypothetical protein